MNGIVNHIENPYFLSYILNVRVQGVPPVLFFLKQFKMMKKIIFLLFIGFFPGVIFAQSNCDFFKNNTIVIEKTGINTSDSDFGASFVGNELWYSAFTEKEINKLSRGVTKDVFYNLFMSPTDLTGNVTGNNSIKLEELSEGYHAGPVSYCPATKELFVTLSNFENPDIKNRVFQKADIRLKIIVVKERNGEWELVEEFRYNSPAFSVGHPAISSTGDTLFFTSDLPDYGFGKTDLYMTIRKNGQWGDLVNLGEQINTKEDDMFPFYYKNNMLIFATKGRGDVAESQRNLDMYYSCSTSDGFSEPQPLEQINTRSDDFGLTIHDNGNLGYFASRKAGGLGDDDIYKVVFEKIATKEIKGKVVDDVTGTAIPGALVVLSDCDGTEIASTNSDDNGDFSFMAQPADCLKAKGSKSPYKDDVQEVKDDYVLLRLGGDYKLELLVRDKNTLVPVPNTTVKFSDNIFFETKADGFIRRGLAANTAYTAISELEGYLNESTAFSTVGMAPGTVKDTLNVEKVKVGQTFTLENIYYDFDKWDILPESEIELNKLIQIMNDNPTWKVELGSHTDSRGSDSYNEWLSQKRSDSAVGYIIANGISSDKIVAKGYGETQLVNRCSNGVSCSDEEHRKNRRTEFKILGMDQ